MRESPFSKVFSKAHVFVFLLLVLALLETSLAALTHFIVRSLVPTSTGAVSRPEVEHWRTQFVASFKKGDELTRTATFTVTHPTVEIDLTLLLPVSHPISDQVTASLQNDVQSFVEAFFGDIQVNAQHLGNEEFSHPEWSVSEGILRVHIHANKTVGGWFRGEITPPSKLMEAIPLAHDAMTLKLERAELESIQPTPAFANEREVQMVAAPGHWLPSLTFMTVERSSTATSTYAGQTGSPREMLQRLAEVVRVPFLSRLLHSLLLFLPLLLFLLLDQKVHPVEAERHPTLSRLVSFAVASLRFGLVLTLVSSMSELLSDQGWLRDVIAWVSRWISQKELGLSPYTEFFRLHWNSAAIVGILAPALLFLRYAEAQPPTWLRVRRFAPYVVALLVALACSAMLLKGQGGSLHWDLLDLAGSLILPVFYFFLLRLSRTIGFSEQSDAPAALAALLLVVLVALGSSLYEAVSLERVSGIVLTALAGGFLTYGWVTLILREFGKVPSVTGWPARLLFLGCTALAVPLLDVAVPGSRFLYTPSVLWLGYRLVSVVLLVWAAGVIWYFYHVGRDSLEATERERLLGVLVTSSLVFVPTSHWCFVPITFLLGLGTLYLFVARPSSRWLAIARRRPSSAQDRYQQINALLDLNAAENGYASLRRQLREKLDKGEIDFKTYEEKLSAERTRLQALQDASIKDGLSVREVALAYGPHRTAWDNATHGAWYALVFATPWLVIGLRDLLTSSDVAFDFPLWAVLHDSVALVARWGIIGFFFGYFYLYLPGRSGLSKGFFFFLAIVLPALPLAGLQMDSLEQWRALTFWGLQTFIECMLLGLVAFDYAALQRGGHRDWRLLLEVHDLPSLSVSVSSILVAIGGAVTTLISGNASALASAALRFILPQVSLGK